MNLLLCALLALSAVQVQAGDGRIVNGTRVPNRGVYPWLATLEQDGSAYCGGSLVAPNVVLTAAHCVEDEEPDARITVSVGRFDYTKNIDGAGTFKGRFVIHPNYNPVSALNDAAVIILEEQLVVNSALPEPVALNTVAARPHPNASVVVTGFGDTFDGSEEGSQQLMHVRLRYYTPRICKALIAEYLATTSDPTPIDNPAVMCAGLPYKDSCQGDSGGPLLLNSGAKKFLQVGIVSNGPACGDPRNPAGIYTRVSAPIIKSFIQAQITANKPVMHGFVALRIQGKLVNCADTICTLNARAGSTIYAMTYFATNKPVKLVLCGMFDTCLTITDGQLGKIPCLLAPEFSVTTATKGRLQLKLDGQCVRSDKKRLVLGNCGGIQSLVTTVPKKKCA